MSCELEDSIKYMTEKMKESLVKGEGEWALEFTKGGSYKFTGTVTGLAEFCRKIEEIPMYVTNRSINNWKVLDV